MVQKLGIGMITLDSNGRICFVLGGFPGSKAANEGSVLPIEKKKESNKKPIE